jgi:hypothetical protein
MRTRSARSRAVGALLALSLCCATNPTPNDRLLTKEEAIASGQGAYALVQYDDRGTLTGELIASKEGYLLVLSDEGHLVNVAWSRVFELTLGVHDNSLGALATWGTLGAVSTISHGFFLVFSLPVWIVTTVAASSSESHSGLFICSPSSNAPTDAAMTRCLADAGTWSRFPQGLPAGVGADELLGRPKKRPAPRLAPPAAGTLGPDGGTLAPDGGASDGVTLVPYDQPS